VPGIGGPLAVLAGLCAHRLGSCLMAPSGAAIVNRVLVGSIWVCGSSTTRLRVASGEEPLGRWLRSRRSAVAGGAGSTGGRRRAVTPPRRGAVTPPMAPRDNAIAKTGRCIRTRTRVMPSRELLRHGADASATRSFAISTLCPSPTETTQERGRATAGKYVLVNPDRVN
jgi:hypothetical protein